MSNTDTDPRDAIDSRTSPATSNLPAIAEISVMPMMLRAEIDGQIATARQFPRNVHNAIRNITSLATLDEETAAESLYALVRKKKSNTRNAAAVPDEHNKAIEGPSIRLAEIAAQCWGNCRIEAHVVSVNRNEKYVEAVGTFHDLETNMASTATVRRNISTSSGYLFSADMITVTGNAACAIAKRNAILAGIPRGIYRPAYQAARGVVAGTVATLSVNRDKAIKAFAAYGVTPAQIFEALDLEGEGDIKLDHIATLRAMFMSIKNGEATVEEMFAKEKPSADPDRNPLVREKTDATTGEVTAAEQGSKTEVQREARDKAPAPASGEKSQASDQESATADSGTSEADASPSSQPDLLSTDGPAVEAPAHDAKPASERGSGSSGPSPAERLRSFSKALSSINDGGPAKLGKQQSAWVTKHGTFEDGESVKQQSIYAAHLNRLTGAVDLPATLAKVEEIVGK
jgi:hypothetical protein